MTEITLTSRGRLTVPKSIRDFLGIAPGSKVAFHLAPSGEVVLRPVTVETHRPSRFSKLRGCATVKMRTDEILALMRGS